MMKSAAILLAVCGGAFADVFLTNPHGSSNKHSAKTTTVTRPDRLFHTRNGAMNVVHTNENGENYQWARLGIDEGGHNAPIRARSMYYFAGSFLPIEWNMHLGCGSGGVGGQENSHHCDIVLQYMCNDMIRDGQTEEPPTLDTAVTSTNYYNYKPDVGYKYGMHESYEYYRSCAARDRNKGLFTGDLSLNGDKATFTRQNHLGSRYGYECAEERDYYPYWLPTPWRDIAVITDRPEKCPNIKTESQNVKAKGYCMKGPGMAATYPSFDNKVQCGSGGAPTSPVWTEVDPWSTAYPHDKAPECKLAPWHPENLLSGGVDGEMMRYNWVVPPLENANCVLRIRYNVSIGDYDKDATALFNKNILNSPVTQEPTTACCAGDASVCNCTLFHTSSHMPFTTYEDRTHVFHILPRPKTIKNNIYNLNVRGHRGNVVQTFPATEYDFVPNKLTCKVGEWIHPQWTGTDNNKQTQAGEGRDYTDRSNIVQIASPKRNKPIASTQQTLFSFDEAVKLAYMDLSRKEGLCSSQTVLLGLNKANRDEANTNCMVLNPQTPYFDGGLQPCPPAGATYYYMSSRNNNFSNRDQKGFIVSEACPAGDPGCSSPDIAPKDSKGDFDPFQPEGNSAASILPSMVALVMAAIALFM